ncbi:MAG TPA: hypothetical protein VH740_18380 [Vicinamibacterales bacterium]|jgi:hypothetical protein
MRTHFSSKAILASAAILSAVLVWTDGTPGAQSRPKFYPDDPLAREPETQDASKTQEWDIGLIADLTQNVFTKPGDLTRGVRAQNVNTIDEVPDSSWFTNRIYAKAITADEITRGPNTLDGPAPGKWTIIRAKTAGTAPGFTVRDEKGDVWFLSLDSKGYPVAATAAISVASRLFWALGYYIPETYLTSFRAENVAIGDKVTVPSHGRRRRFTHGDLHDVLASAHRSADGSYRAIAQRGLPGRVIGGFKYHGTRPDDPNDVVPHEHRRELRALQVFGGWTNLVDMKAGNTLDSVVTENGRSVVRHYLQDVGSTFGTGSLHPREGDEGYEHVYEGGPTAKRLFTFGLALSPWQTVDYVEHPEIGRFSAEAYEPDEWKPRVPAGALLRVRDDDTFWAALRVMAFTDEHIRAAVKTGKYTDPAAEKLLADVLIERRNKIGRTYLRRVNPLTKFALDGSGVLTFENAAVRAQVAEAPKGGYTASWFRFDNATGATQPIGSATKAGQERVQAPSDLPRAAGSYIKVSVAAVDPASPLTASWSKPVDVYFRSSGSGWQLVGVERLPVGPAPNSVKKN